MTKKKMIDCLVLTPVGPNCDVDNVIDTINSFIYYMANSNCIMAIMDDTRADILSKHFPEHPSLRIITAQQSNKPLENIRPNFLGRLKRAITFLSSEPTIRNTRGQLFVKQMRCISELSEEFDWRCVLRLDDDALIIGPDPQNDALRAFDSNPELGMLGAYLRRGDGSDKQAAMKVKAGWIKKQLRDAERYGQDVLLSTLQKSLTAAKSNGYISAHMCTGGAFFISRGALDGFNLKERELKSLDDSFLDDDLLYSLLTVSAGYQMKDFSDQSDIMAINWRGLPMPLIQLAALGKKVVHPVKDVHDASLEKQVRAFFLARRQPASSKVRPERFAGTSRKSKV